MLLPWIDSSCPGAGTWNNAYFDTDHNHGCYLHAAPDSHSHPDLTTNQHTDSNAEPISLCDDNKFPLTYEHPISHCYRDDPTQPNEHRDYNSFTNLDRNSGRDRDPY
jgi:hypothetical protein